MKFKAQLTEFCSKLGDHVSTDDGQWSIKGFIDTFRSIYTISADTKIISKVLEIHLFPKLLQFAQENSYQIRLAEHQNYYPDLSFVSNEDESIKYAVDIKTTYRKPNGDNPPVNCNGFTLGSHGKYFTDRLSSKNIQFPYSEYSGHFCLGIIYSRSKTDQVSELTVHPLDELQSIVSVIRDMSFFFHEKWEIASDSEGSSNTANIGSIKKISDLLKGHGTFKNLGEKWFDEYWINYGKVSRVDNNGKSIPIRDLRDYLIFKGMDPELAFSPPSLPRKRKKIKDG